MSTVLVPSLAANCLAIASPTAPPPMTCNFLDQLTNLVIPRDDEPYSMSKVSLSYSSAREPPPRCLGRQLAPQST